MDTLPASEQELLAVLVHLVPQSPDDGAFVWRAYDYAGQKRASQLGADGQPSIRHPLEVARIVAEYIAEPGILAAALLHDLVEDGLASIAEIESHFSSEVAQMIDGVTKLKGLEGLSLHQRDARNLRKLFMAMVSDPRVVILKLADRIHNMRTIEALPAERQRKLAQETFDIFAHIAEMFGIWEMKRELEDSAFRVLDPQNYKLIRAAIARNSAERGDIVSDLIAETRQLIADAGLPVDRFQISGRPKHLYSIFQKLQKPKYRGHGVERVYDKLGIRIIVENKEQCYGVLGLIHGRWPSIAGEFDDFISNRLPSGYQSLHTAVRFGPEDNDVSEVQIRTFEMHEVAEHGVAAHWRYKDGYQRKDPTYESKLEWLRGLISSLRDADEDEFLRRFTSKAFESHMIVFTPKGQIIELPEGATPVDFAYRIHSEVGNHCMGARVNGRIVPLDTPLHNGEIVDIMTAKTSRGPSRDWLNFVRTTGARSHIRRFFRRAARDENIAAGRDLLEKELRRLNVSFSFDALLAQTSAKSIEDMFALIGAGDLTARSVVARAQAQQQNEQAQPAALLSALPLLPSLPRRQPIGIQVIGVGSVQNRLARCCNPVVGEPIVGYVTRGRGITVHRVNCPTVTNERDRDRLIDVAWGSDQSRGYSVPVRVESWDRVGLWRDVSAIIADQGINIERVEQGKSGRAGRAVLHITITIQNISQLGSLLDKLNRIPDVIEARRESQGDMKAS